MKHGAAGSPARWKQHVNQTNLRNRGNMIFQHLKNTFFTSIISTACVVVFLFKKKKSKNQFFFLVFNDCWGGQLYGRGAHVPPSPPGSPPMVASRSSKVRAKPTLTV